MVKQYLSANVFICPSSIKNRPNSLSKAQILGVPFIASYVGGIPDMVPNNSFGNLYQFEENEVLAKKIFQLFNNSCNDNSEDKLFARKRHSSRNNLKNHLKIYNEIFNNDCLS